jgi:hypothetical protein
MGLSSKFWLALMIVMPGGLIAGPVLWLLQRWRKQRLLAVHPSIHA